MNLPHDNISRGCLACFPGVKHRVVTLQIGQTNIEGRRNKAEKFEARKALVPVLQAEEDRRSLQQYGILCCPFHLSLPDVIQGRPV